MSVYTDIFGDVIDVATVKDAFVATLQARLTEQLALQEVRYGLPARTFPEPKSWLSMSQFSIRAEDQLPAIVVELGGSSSNPVRDQKGGYRKTWPFNVHVGIKGQTQDDAERLASVYLAAVTAAIVQNGTLGGIAMQSHPSGPDVYRAGSIVGSETGSQGAIYSTTFDVTVRAVVNDLKGPASPLPDPYNPTPPADPFDTAAITVTSIALEDTP